MVGTALLVLRFLEIRQDVIIAPAFVAALAPAIVVLVLAADVKQPVDRTRSAEHLAARLNTVRPSSPGSGSVWYIQLTAFDLNKRPYPSGTWIQMFRSFGPASSSSTEFLPSALSRLASTHPAEPAPTMM